MTAIADSFPAGVPQLTWTKVSGGGSWQGNASGWMQAGTGASTTSLISNRADSDLSTADMEVSFSVACTTLGTAGTFGGPTARNSSTGANFYRLSVNPSATNSPITLYRVIANVATSLTSWTDGVFSASAFRKLTVRVAGTNPVHLEALIDNVSLGVYSDTDAARIQTGTRGGSSQQAGLSGAAVIYMDTFAATDWVYVPPVKALAAKVSTATSAKQGVVLRFR